MNNGSCGYNDIHDINKEAVITHKMHTQHNNMSPSFSTKKRNITPLLVGGVRKYKKRGVTVYHKAKRNTGKKIL